MHQQTTGTPNPDNAMDANSDWQKVNKVTVHDPNGEICVTFEDAWAKSSSTWRVKIRTDTYNEADLPPSPHGLAVFISLEEVYADDDADLEETVSTSVSGLYHKGQHYLLSLKD